MPIDLKVKLALAGARQTVTVEAAGADLLENVPYAHNDVDTKSLDKLPISSPGSGLSDAVMLSSGAVAADSNGFFHPLGDHAQTSFSIDGQPIGDQQSKGFSTQIPLDAIQSMELITGAPPAEFGDKTSLIVNAVTKSGLGQKPNGSLMGQWGSFGTYSEEATLAAGRSEGRKFPGCQHDPVGPLSGYSGVHADSRHRQQRHDLRSLRLSANFPGRVPSESVRGPELVSDSQHVRPAWSGPAAEGTDLQLRSGLSAHFWRQHRADHQSFLPSRSRELLSERGSVQRYAGDDLSGPHPDQLGRESRCVLRERAATT